MPEPPEFTAAARGAVDLATFRLHNGAQVVNREPLTIECPPQRWAYAFDFPLSCDGAATVDVLVDVTVIDGECGIGLVTADETAFHVEKFIEAEDGRATVMLPLDAGQLANWLVFRNAAVSGPTVVEVHGIRVQTAEERPRPRLKIASDVFRRFQPFSGTVPAGFWANWLGVMTRAHVWPFPPEVRAVYSRERTEHPGYPIDEEHVLDWVPLLQAVESAGPMFRMVALGAGWGRWLSAGAFAARQTGRSVSLIGVEAEPDHFAWMTQHMQDNGIDSNATRLLRAAASATTDPCWFPIETPDWYGQSIVVDEGGTSDTADRWANGVRLRRVQAVTIEDVVPGDHVVDYVHMDIQGTEYDFLARNPERLATSVRVVNVGTHSENIERRLRTLFTSLGWSCRYDITLGAIVDVYVDDEVGRSVTFGDGVQVWTNPTLT